MAECDVRLNESALLEAACQKTGLSDFGDDGFREGLQVLLKALREEAQLSEFGYVIIQSSITDYLANRLEMTDWHKRYPGIAEGEIRRPIFVIGMPRTGTSILHELLAQDPASRTPLSWEVARPCPPPERETYDTDPRIAEVDANLAQTDWLIPEFKQMHPMGAKLPQECVGLMAHDFASMQFQTMYYVPSYGTWLDHETDWGPVYASHRRQLQLLQWRCPAERWVLKSPCHLWSLEALLAEYPDALLVQTHRDPIKIIASVTSLVTVLRSMASDYSDRLEFARKESGKLELGLNRSVEARENGTINEAQVIDIQFDDFMTDPFGIIRKIYDHFGLEYTAEAESRMRRFLQENPSDKHGKHTYRFSDTGLNFAEEREKVRRYQEYFGVPSEDVA